MAKSESRTVLHPDVAQGDLEGFLLVRPDASLTGEVEHVQWEDNHPAGPDTHVTVSFDDGTNVEFPFGVPVVKVAARDVPSLTPAQLTAAAPARWGRDAGRWDDA
ncbi:hypothetical protein SAMN05421541_10913 [Actinoplanes philippinensis]|uniref:Uncharacterized protein n=1 Tax=Actinoplanes philippinensis TaxID=35752 RepID=A0A1I2HXT6_9ACTN|nr:hypothetical protein [Actinoplanes philippinensis]SFF34170.1 hypothetical protein SAMN05421541_10913 [Actinoplanes philippinensis]